MTAFGTIPRRMCIASIVACLLAAAFAMEIDAANAVEHPQMKEGLWQIRTQTVDNPGSKKSESTVQVCRDHAFDEKTEALARTIKGCSTIKESFAGGKYTSEMSCKVGNTVIASRGVATFGGDTSAHSETHVTYTPAFGGNTDKAMIQDQTYLGRCPAGCTPETEGIRTEPARGDMGTVRPLDGRRRRRLVVPACVACNAAVHRGL